VNNVEAAEVLKSQLRCDDRQQFMAIGWRKALELAVTALEHQPEPQRFEVGTTYPATVNGENGTVTFFSQEAADAYSKQLQDREALACDACRTIVPNLETVVCPRCGSVDLRHIQTSDIGRQEVKS
jgi:hypothetical protein